MLEYGLDVGCVSRDVRHHDENLFRIQLRVLLQHRQDVILQYLAFAHCAVTNVNADRVIRFDWLRAGFEGKDRTLNLV